MASNIAASVLVKKISKYVPTADDDSDQLAPPQDLDRFLIDFTRDVFSIDNSHVLVLIF
jgi:hypothetical protein